MAEHTTRRIRRTESADLPGYAEASMGISSLAHVVVSAIVTPAELKAGGAGLEILWGFHGSPFGECLVGTTPLGICWISFVNRPGEDPLDEFRRNWPSARLVEEAGETGRLAERVFGGERAWAGSPLPILLHGTRFQIQVWRALLEIPDGAMTTYGAVAHAIGSPGAARAVGRAVGGNRIAYLIPCHRVIRSTGDIGGYRWGVARKKAMLGREA